ncbi:MAG: tRNA-uridine aminocarboxypropyltransferase [Candidatus Binatia bacterium]
MSTATARHEPGVRPPRLECYTCFKPQVACICASIERVPNRTGVIILQHPHERLHPVGTVRIARLGLERVRVESCAPWLDATAIRARLPAQAALLYPGPGAVELSTLAPDERPRHLVLIDATWFKAKKIYAAHDWLRALPHLQLRPSVPSRYRIRREPQPHFVATLEAIVDALRILEPQTSGLDGLVDAFVAMIDRQATFMGR